MLVSHSRALEAGLNLVVELALWHPSSRLTAATTFAPYDAWLIGLRWDPEELERREQARADGIRPGTALGQAVYAAAWDLPHDFVVDAVTKSPQAQAQEIVAWLAARPASGAIREIIRSTPRQRALSSDALMENLTDTAAHPTQIVEVAPGNRRLERVTQLAAAVLDQGRYLTQLRPAAIESHIFGAFQGGRASGFSAFSCR